MSAGGRPAPGAGSSGPDRGGPGSGSLGHGASGHGGPGSGRTGPGGPGPGSPGHGGSGPGLRFPLEGVPGPGMVREVAPGILWARMPLPLRLNHVNVWLLDDAEEPATGAGRGRATARRAATGPGEAAAGGSADARPGAGRHGEAAGLGPAAGDFLVVDTGLGDDLTRGLWEQVLDAAGRGWKDAAAEGGGSGEDRGADSRGGDGRGIDGRDTADSRGGDGRDGPAIGGRREVAVRRIVVTHFHPDHSGAVEWLAGRDGAEVLMSRGEHEIGLASVRRERGSGSWSALERLDPHGLPEATRQVLLAPERPFASLTPGIPETFTPLAEGDALSIGSHEWRVMTGHGRSPEHVSLYCESARILISGDMLLPHISSHVGSPVTWGHGNPVVVFQQSLARTAELPDDTLVLPSHGVPFTGIRARVAALFEHHEERCDRMLAAVDRRGAGRARPAAAGGPSPSGGRLPPTAGDLLEALFPKGLDPLQVILAMNETIAHLAYLEDRGDLRRLAGDDGKIRWERTGRAAGGAAPRAQTPAAALSGDGAAGAAGAAPAVGTAVGAQN